MIPGSPTSPVFAGTACYINSVKCLSSLQTLELMTRACVLLQGQFHNALSGIKASLTRLRDTYNSLEKQLPLPPLTLYPWVPTCFAPVAWWTGQAVFSLCSPWNISNSIGRTRYRYLRSLQAVEPYRNGRERDECKIWKPSNGKNYSARPFCCYRINIYTAVGMLLCM